MMWTVEVTDTFGGEANYSWVRRSEVSAPDGATDRQLARLFKDAGGFTGSRGRATWHGDTYEFRPYGQCVVLFATLHS